MKLGDHDFRLYKDFRESLEILGFFYLVFPACGAFASVVTGSPVIAGVVACLVMAVLLTLAMLGWAMLKYTACVRQPWLTIMGTTVVCRQPVQSWWHLNRDEDPVWQWLEASGIHDADVYQADDKRTFVFRRRSHAVMFKLVWGGR